MLTSLLWPSGVQKSLGSFWAPNYFNLKVIFSCGLNPSSVRGHQSSIQNASSTRLVNPNHNFAIFTYANTINNSQPKKLKVLEVLSRQPESPHSSGQVVFKKAWAAFGLHTIIFTCRFQNTACRLPYFHRTHSSAALLYLLWQKNSAH